MTGLSFDAVREAQRRIAGVALETPLVPSPYLSRLAGQDVLLKLELALSLIHI